MMILVFNIYFIIVKTIEENDKYDFLIDIVPRKVKVSDLISKSN
jgi:hypothetical protein